jgi:nicotinamidase-related amidase
VSAETLDPTHTALLFFDMLNGYVKAPEPDAQARYAPVLANAQRLLAAARAAGMLVAYAHANHRADRGTTAVLATDTDNRLRPISERTSGRSGITAGSWEAAIPEEIAPRVEDYLIPKFRWSAFYQTYLDLALRTRAINTLILCGGSTDVGVASTAFAARDMDYNLVIVHDACTSPEQDNHDQFMRRIFPRMARVRSTEQTIQMLAVP